MTSATTFDLLTQLYRDEPMQQVWSADAAIAAWLSVEAALALAQGDADVISVEDAQAIAAVCVPGSIDAEHLWRDGANVGYPILPLVRQLSAALPEGPHGRVHYGATTQDIMDSGLALQIRAAMERIITLVDALGQAISDLIRTHGDLVMAGRTHAQQAVPTTFGAKWAVFLEELRQRRELLQSLEASVPKISLFGAGGTNAAMGPKSAQVRNLMASSLGLVPCDVPWHVAREGLADVGHALATTAAFCVRLAREVIDLSRTEIAEVREEFGHHRGASSTMPQKANPIYCEAIVGFGACCAALSGSLLRAIEAGHERAAGEWQVEWIAIPQLFNHTATALGLSYEVITNLQVFSDAMARNLQADHGLILSEAAMMHLAPSMGREAAHDAIYAAATKARQEDMSLTDALQLTLAPDVAAIAADVAAHRYVGEAPQVVRVALAAWDAAVANTALAKTGSANSGSISNSTDVPQTIQHNQEDGQ